MKSRSAIGRRAALACAAALALTFAPRASAAELAGVKLPDTFAAGEKVLKLNGLGLRKKAIFKVYVGGLYLESPTKDAAAVVAADAPKAIVMHFVRSVGKEKLVDAFKEGFENNAKDKMAALKASIDKFLAMTPDAKDGDEWKFTYVPGKGTSSSFAGRDAGTIEGKGFADALFLLWMGPKPPSDDLKKGMLGL